MKCLRPGETGTIMIEDVDVASIVTRDLSDDRRSARAIEDYAHAYAAGAQLPPVEVFLVEGRMLLVDGDHRVKARLALRELGIVAKCVGKGTKDDALRYALKGTNRAHGLRLSPEDCELRVFLALDSGIWDSPSANALGSDLGISHVTARKYMERWEEARAQKLPTQRVDAGGRKQAARRSARVETVNTEAADTHQHRVETVNTSADAPLPFETLPETATPMAVYGRALLRVAGDLRTARLDALRLIPEIDELNGVRQSVERAIKDAEGALKNAEPIVCPKCSGVGCTPCGARGWLSRMAAAR